MSTPYTPPGRDPTGNPRPPQNPPPEPCSVTVPAEPPAVADDPLEAQHQAGIWRERMIAQEYVIAELGRQIAKLSAQLKAKA